MPHPFMPSEALARAAGTDPEDDRAFKPRKRRGGYGQRGGADAGAGVDGGAGLLSQVTYKIYLRKILV